MYTSHPLERSVCGLRRARALCAALVLLAGCVPTSAPAPQTPPTVTAVVGQAGNQKTFVAGQDQPKAKAPEHADAEVEETWDVSVIRGTKVGYAHTTIRPTVEGERRLLRIDSQQVISLRRFGQTTSQELALTSFETPTGQLVRFECRLTAGKQMTLSQGRVAGRELVIETTTPGKTTESRMPWTDESGGFFAPELGLRRERLKPGQKRSHRVLIPALNQPGETKLEALTFEAVDVDGQSRQLLKIRKTDTIAGTAIDSYLWVDERGDALKSFLPIPPPGIESYRTTREKALAEEHGEGFDLGAMSIVKVAKRIPNPHATRRIKYRARLAEGDAAQVFATGLSQSVEKHADGTLAIEVRAVRGDVPEQVERIDPPNEQDRQPNNLVQSDAPIIRRMASETAPDESDPWKLAVALERYVRQAVHIKNFSQAFATAAEVAESRTGDCTEHAVLLAALCRARGLPARVAIGLVYAPELGGFAYHMWNEVWVTDRWVPLDGTLGKGGIGGAHLKLLTSNLNGMDAYGAFLPVFRVLGRLQLEVLEIEPLFSSEAVDKN